MSMNAASSLSQMQNNTSKIQFEQGQKRMGQSSISREGFLQIIMAQMQFQDPTSPQDYSQMLGQQVQLELADKMGSLVDTTKFSQASSLIGKSVTLPAAQYDFKNGVSGAVEYDLETNQPKSVTGIVQSVQYDKTNNKAVIQVDGKYYDADSINQVGVTGTLASGTGSSTQTQTP